MNSPPKVLLKFLGISFGNSKAVSTDLAVLGGTMAVLLGDESSAAGLLTRYAAGHDEPRKGKVLTGRGMAPANSREGRAATGCITDRIDAPPGMTARGCVYLAVTASGKNRSVAASRTDEILQWLDLEKIGNIPVEDLKPPEIQRTGMAVCLATSPELLVVDCPLHDSLHSKLKTFTNAGNAVLIRASSLGQIPYGVERIALCDSTGIVRVVRHSELLARAMGGAEITAAFYPSLQREKIETINGIKNLLHRDGKYRFTHTETTYAITQLMNLARANSRAIAELHLAPVPPEALIALFSGDKDKTGLTGLFEESL